MYHKLAEYYDALLKDDEAVSWWKDFFIKHHYKNTVLELASGTGEITLALAEDFTVDATDLSEEMLEKIKLKDHTQSINDIYQLNMLDLSADKTYDNIICFCDSINYLLSDEDFEVLIEKVSAALNDEGVFMFDMHTEDRLPEFQDPFIETGQLLNTDYQWTITSEDRYIYHHFVFYEDSIVQEYHTQYVFDLDFVKKVLEKYHFSYKIYTDFDQEGVHEGEKLFIVAKKPASKQ